MLLNKWSLCQWYGEWEPVYVSTLFIFLKKNYYYDWEIMYIVCVISVRNELCHICDIHPKVLHICSKRHGFFYNSFIAMRRLWSTWFARNALDVTIVIWHPTGSDCTWCCDYPLCHTYSGQCMDLIDIVCIIIFVCTLSLMCLLKNDVKRFLLKCTQSIQVLMLTVNFLSR